MLITHYSEQPPPYKSYKHDKFERHKDKLKKQIQQIKECSLREEDKIKLYSELKKLIP